MHASPSSTSLGNIPGKLLCYTLGGNREKGKANKGLGRMEVINLGCHQVLPLMHLHPTSVVVPGGTSKMPPLVRDRLSLTREGELPVEPDSMDMSLCELRQMVTDREAWYAAVHGFTKSRA